MSRRREERKEKRASNETPSAVTCGVCERVFDVEDEQLTCPYCNKEESVEDGE